MPSYMIDGCEFCGIKHIAYGKRTPYTLTTLAQKSSYELLITILNDMKKFIRNNSNDPTLRESITCFCKYSILTCEEETENRRNGFTDFYRVIFEGIIKLAGELRYLELTSEFIDKVNQKLWEEHEELLARINVEQSEKSYNAR